MTPQEAFHVLAQAALSPANKADGAAALTIYSALAEVAFAARLQAEYDAARDLVQSILRNDEAQMNFDGQGSGRVDGQGNGRVDGQGQGGNGR